MSYSTTKSVLLKAIKASLQEEIVIDDNKRLHQVMLAAKTYWEALDWNAKGIVDVLAKGSKAIA